MTLLCIDTTTAVCSAALCQDGALLKQCICREGSNHARLLPRYIQELLVLVREKKLTIDAVALSEGPGSYTGLRIGASTAKGLCYGFDIPLIPVPTLQVLCEAARQKSEVRIQNSDVLCPMIDARRMEVYTMVDGETKAVVVESEQSLTANDAAVWYFGDGAAKCQSVLTNPRWHYIPDIVPEAQYVAALAEQSTTRIQHADLAYYEPYYLKEFIAAQSHVKGLK
ncbi:MAG: tRNA (adenosine(37)-N6)-threonylcarbamoyltransferase complex dimerization subunit type 1 TsaB [Paludibacteraceae bacterium]|nr:tRNA (adenosine(37)-N6)-threonylcarbamoyltransferase complex dimerization subunit type 1 TsaB [Paludibacteraceae bacterium]